MMSLWSGYDLEREELRFCVVGVVGREGGSGRRGSFPSCDVLSFDGGYFGRSICVDE